MERRSAGSVSSGLTRRVYAKTLMSSRPPSLLKTKKGPEAEDLRRGPRVDTCCRAIVQDAHGVWTAIADDLGKRGARLVTSREPRVGSYLLVTLSSDLFETELRVTAQVMWIRKGRVGIMFERETGEAAAAWLEQLSSVDGLGARIRSTRPPRAAPERQLELAGPPSSRRRTGTP
jgi:hypothetical protein